MAANDEAMTVQQYCQKVQTLLQNSDNHINGLPVNDGTGISISHINNFPALTFCKTDNLGNPSDIQLCLILEDPRAVRRMEIWLEDALNVFKMKKIQESNANILVTGNAKGSEETTEEETEQKTE